MDYADYYQNALSEPMICQVFVNAIPSSAPPTIDVMTRTRIGIAKAIPRHIQKRDVPNIRLASTRNILPSLPAKLRDVN